MSQFFASGGHSIGASASASGLPMNIHSGLISFRIDWFDLLAVQGLSKCGYLSIKENPALRDKLLK